VEANKLSPNLNPISADASELMIPMSKCQTGKNFHDPLLAIDHLRFNAEGKSRTQIARSDKAMTDCRRCRSSPCRRRKSWAKETGVAVDQRFRPMFARS